MVARFWERHVWEGGEEVGMDTKDRKGGGGDDLAIVTETTQRGAESESPTASLTLDYDDFVTELNAAELLSSR